jgi:hypothetical protein
MTSPLLSVGPQTRPDMRALSVDRNELHVFQGYSNNSYWMIAESGSASTSMGVGVLVITRLSSQHSIAALRYAFITIEQHPQN